MYNTPPPGIIQFYEIFQGGTIHGGTMARNIRYHQPVTNEKDRSVNNDYRSTSHVINNNNSVDMRLSDHNNIEKIIKQFEKNQKILIKQGK